MSKTILLFLIFPWLSFSQSFLSKVATSKNQMVKFETLIFVSDSIISIETSGQTIKYFVEERVAQLYKTSLHGAYYDFTVVKTSGKSKGFKYTHTISLISVTNPQLPILSYLAIIKPE